MTRKKICSVASLVVMILVVCGIVSILGFKLTGPLKIEANVWLPEKYSGIGTILPDGKYKSVSVDEIKKYNDLSIAHLCNGLAYIKTLEDEMLIARITFPFTNFTFDFPRRFTRGNLALVAPNRGEISLEYERNKFWSLIFGVIIPIILAVFILRLPRTTLPRKTEP